MFKIAVVTDELSSDFETAVELASEWGIRNVEIRGISDERIGSHTPYSAQHIKKIVKNFGVNIVSVSPGIFKVNHHAPVFEGWTVLKWQDRYEFDLQRARQEAIEKQLSEVLPCTIEFCREVGCRRIVIFSFNMPDGSPLDLGLPEYLLDYFRQACAVAANAGMTLLMENEHICYGNTVKNTRRIIEAVGCDNLKLNWDPGNAYFSHEHPYPDAYEKIKDIIGHVHMKDAVTHHDGSMEYVVEGTIDWEGQIRSLIDDGYDGYLSIETHCRPKVKSARDALARILAVTGEGAL